MCQRKTEVKHKSLHFPVIISPLLLTYSSGRGAAAVCWRDMLWLRKTSLTSNLSPSHGEVMKEKDSNFALVYSFSTDMSRHLQNETAALLIGRTCLVTEKRF